MRMPGFTAEASLFQASNYVFQASEHATDTPPGAVIPQRGVCDGICYDDCREACAELPILRGRNCASLCRRACCIGTPPYLWT